MLLSNGKYGITFKIEIKELDEPETTYNFQVADYHTNYVGESRVLCHNMNCSTKVIEVETYANKTMKMEDTVKAWDDFLGPN